MPSGGFRSGTGRPKGAVGIKKKTEAEKAKEAEKRIKEAAEMTGISPLEYMLRIMRDPEIEPNRRDRMALAAASFMHNRVGETGKKVSKEEKAREVGQGKFSPSRAPLRAVK